MRSALNFIAHKHACQLTACPWPRPNDSNDRVNYCSATAAAAVSGWLLLLKSVEFDDDVALLLSVAGLVMGPHVTSESEI